MPHKQMIPTTVVVVISILLPAIAVQNKLTAVKARVKKIHEATTLFEEIGREGDRAVLTVGILPATQVWTDGLERFLDLNTDFAQDFGTTGRNAIYLARLYLNQSFFSERGIYAFDHLERQDVYGELVTAVEEFEEWLERMRRTGIIEYEADDQPPVYVGPGVDTITEEIRGIVRLLNNMTAQVPKDAVRGGELYIQSALSARLLAMLGIGLVPDYSEDVVLLQRCFLAMFRLSFRHPAKMIFDDKERELVVDYLKLTFEVIRDAYPEGVDLPANALTLSESLERIQNWKREKSHEDL